MNAQATFTRAVSAYDLNAAHMEAHRWADIARPLIRAYLALDLIHGDVLCASHAAGVYAYSISSSADDLGKAVGELRKDIEGIRDAVLGDLSPPQPNWGRPMHECSPEMIDYDDLCEVWEERIRDVLSVDAAIDLEARK